MPTLTQRMADLATGTMLTPADVTAVDHCAPGFVRVELQAEQFRGARWRPGEKLQFRARRGTFLMRTYTPTRWDSEHGVTELVAYTHGDGPAAEWFRTVSTGDTCEAFGPRRSLDFSDTVRRVVFVGDESSVALACALRTHTADVRHVFEAAVPDDLAAMLATVHVACRGDIVTKTGEHTELLRRAKEHACSADTPYELAVTGDAATVHAVRRTARTWPNPPARIHARAYWAAGRTGLD